MDLYQFGFEIWELRQLAICKNTLSIEDAPWMSDFQSNTRFLCPVKTCSRAFKTKSTWTRHLRSVHPLVKVEAKDATIITLPRNPVFPTQDNHQVSPPNSPEDDRGLEYVNNDIEMGPPSPGMWLISTSPHLIINALPDFEAPNSSSPPHSHFFEPELAIENHPHINGQSPPYKLRILLITSNRWSV